MALNINGVTVSGGTSIVATDASANKLFEQTSTGRVLNPTNSGGTLYTPMFNVGLTGTAQWTTFSGVIPFRYTGGSGYYNVGGCYNTSTYAFTAPLAGLYLFKHHIYCYGPNSTAGWYVQPQFLVNGSRTVRRPGGGIYRMRLYGMRADYANDTDCCELIPLQVGDYVQAFWDVSGTLQGYEAYSAFSGAYLGG